MSNFETNYYYYLNLTNLDKDISPGQFKVLVGGLDFTSFVTQVGIRRPKAEINTPYSWEGELVLSEPINATLLPESLDDLQNPARWAIGVHPIQIYFGGVLFVTLRIHRYFYDEKSRQGKAQLTDQLGLRDYMTPAEDFEGLGFTVGSNTPATSVVDKALFLAGCGGSVSIPGSYEVPPNKFNESYISFAQKICGERGYWLYCDKNELVSAVYYNRKISAQPLFLRSRDWVDDFDRQDGMEIPAQLYRVTGTAEGIAKCNANKDGVILEEFIELPSGHIALLRRETVEILKNGPDILQKKIKVEAALGAIMPDDHPNKLGVYKIEETLETSLYNTKDGRLLSFTQETGRLLGLALPNDYPGNRQFIKLAEKLEEAYFCYLPGEIGRVDDSVLRQKTHNIKKLYLSPIAPTGNEPSNVLVFSNAKYIFADSEIIAETWNNGNSQKQPPCLRFTYRKVSYIRQEPQLSEGEGEESTSGNKVVTFGARRDIGAMKRTSEVDYDATAPAWPTREPDTPVGSYDIKGECYKTPATYSPYVEKEFETTCSTLTTDAEAKELACLIGDLQNERYLSRLITLPLALEYLNNPTPFAIVHIHNGAFIMDSPALALEKAEGGYKLELSFVGNYLGAIPALPSAPSAPVFIPVKAGLGVALPPLEIPSYPIETPVSPYIDIGKILVDHTHIVDASEPAAIEEILEVLVQHEHYPFSANLIDTNHEHLIKTENYNEISATHEHAPLTTILSENYNEISVTHGHVLLTTILSENYNEILASHQHEISVVLIETAIQHQHTVDSTLISVIADHSHQPLVSQ
jgi:hypothetical protein